MAYTPITPLPAVPDANDGPDTFTEDADAFLGALPTWANQVNAAGTYIDTIGSQVDADKTASAASATAAANSAAAALNSQNLAAASADFKGAWSSLTGALNKPATVSHNGSFWALLNNLANVTTSTPSLTNADWQFISGTRFQATRTANFTVARNAMENVTATSATIDATLSSFSAGDFFFVNSNPASTQLVRIVKSGVTVAYKNQTVATGDNITLRAGETFRAFAISSTGLVAY